MILHYILQNILHPAECSAARSASKILSSKSDYIINSTLFELGLKAVGQNDLDAAYVDRLGQFYDIVLYGRPLIELLLDCIEHTSHLNNACFQVSTLSCSLRKRTIYWLHRILSSFHSIVAVLALGDCRLITLIVPPGISQWLTPLDTSNRPSDSYDVFPRVPIASLSHYLLSSRLFEYMDSSSRLPCCSITRPAPAFRIHSADYVSRPSPSFHWRCHNVSLSQSSIPARLHSSGSSSHWSSFPLACLWPLSICLGKWTVDSDYISHLYYDGSSAIGLLQCLAISRAIIDASGSLKIIIIFHSYKSFYRDKSREAAFLGEETLCFCSKVLFIYLVCAWLEWPCSS